MHSNSLLFEISSEVCHKMGGINTVISTKAAYVQRRWQGNYFLIGPFMGEHALPDNRFEETSVKDIANPALRQAAQQLNKDNKLVHVGKWQIKGSPVVFLLDPMQLPAGYDEFRNYYLRDKLDQLPDLFMAEAYIRFGYAILVFLEAVKALAAEGIRIISHFHEYLTTASLQKVKELGIRTIFTTHATVIGRFLAEFGTKMSNKIIYGEQPSDIYLPSKYHRFCLLMEREAATQAEVFTTVSETTAAECNLYLNRRPSIAYNGLDVSTLYKEETEIAAHRHRLTDFVDKHFAFTKQRAATRRLYFFISGRLEYKAKGFDVTVEAVARLNAWLQKTALDAEVIVFFITDEPHKPKKSILSKVINIKHPLKKYIFLNKPITKSYFTRSAPLFYYDTILIKNLTYFNLNNDIVQKVRIILQPGFLTTDSPLGLDYPDFVSACDMGLFPSLYEPWGYTAMECVASGTPVILSNTSGFGNYVAQFSEKLEDMGIFMLDRKGPNAVEEMYQIMKQRVLKPDNQPRTTGTSSRHLLDWDNMISAYDALYTAC